MIQFGEMQPERGHDYRSNHGDLSPGAAVVRGNSLGASAIIWNSTLAVRPGPMLLSALYWGEEVGKNFDISIDGTRIVNERRATPPEKRFVSATIRSPSADPRQEQGDGAVRNQRYRPFVYEARTLGTAN